MQRSTSRNLGVLIKRKAVQKNTLRKIVQRPETMAQQIISEGPAAYAAEEGGCS